MLVGQTGSRLHGGCGVGTPGRLQGVRCAAGSSTRQLPLGVLLCGKVDAAWWAVVTGDPPLSCLRRLDWLRREPCCAAGMCNTSGPSPGCRQKEFMAALRWLDWLLRERGDEPELWARVMYVQLGFGDIAAAEQTILRLAALLQASVSATVLHRCVVHAMACTPGPVRLTACV